MALAVFAVGGSMVATDPAFAKVDVDKLTISGEARIRYEVRTNADFGGGAAAAGQSNSSVASHRIRVGVGYDLTPDVSFFAQLQDARVWGGEGCGLAATAGVLTGGNTCGTNSGIGAVSSANNGGTGVDLHQGYILVKNLFAPGLSLKAGRQELIYGDHRLFGHFGWSQIGNSFDAVKFTYSAQMADVDLFWARIADTENGTLGSTTGVVFPATGGKGTNDQDIYGLYVTLKPIANWTIEPYYFLLQDSRPVVAGALSGATATPQAPDQTRNTVGARLNGKAGGLDATLEVAHQFGGGATGATSQKHNVHINAHAEAAKVGYTFGAVPMKPRIGIEVDYASGDSCKTACGHANTFDNLYPTNHFHYGYMDLMAWKNMVNYQLMFDVKPSDVSKLQVNFIIHRLANTKDNWYRAGQVIYGTSGAAGTGTAGRGNTAASIGRELNIHYWHTLKEKFKFEVGYGHFWAGDYIANAARYGNTILGRTPTSASGQNWGYVMGSVLF
jgi:hypothetical protein